LWPLPAMISGVRDFRTAVILSATMSRETFDLRPIYDRYVSI
jgi:hypothetical protein